mgnify:CR=1 FL=1
MIVYHTSDTCFERPDTVHSREALDFGKGFYVTKLMEQAVNYSERFTRLGQSAFVHSFEYTPAMNIKVKVFDTYDEEWLDFVCKCRKGGDIYLDYDIIEGGVANDKVFRTVDLYMAGIYDKEQALSKLIFEKPNHQLCFVTQNAIDSCLKFVERKEIKNG